MLKNNHGLTLLEVLLSITILGAFLIAFSAMIGNGMLANNANQERLDALLLAQECMETIKVQEADAFPSIPTCRNDINDNIFIVDPIIDLDVNINNLYNITVEVTGQTGAPIELKTQLFKP